MVFPAPDQLGDAALVLGQLDTRRSPQSETVDLLAGALGPERSADPLEGVAHFLERSLRV